MPFTIEAPKGPDIPAGTYKAQLLKVETGQGQFGSQRKWFWLVNVDGKGEELSVLSSTNTSPSSKSYKWLTALLGKAPQVGETIEDPTGKTVMLNIGPNDKGYPTILDIIPIVEPVQTEAGIPR